MLSRSTLSAKIYCALQIGYFKAKQLFFDLPWDDVPDDDIAFIMNVYFPEQVFLSEPLTSYERYTQIRHITNLYGYRLWAKEYTGQLYEHVIKTSKRMFQ